MKKETIYILIIAAVALVPHMSFAAAMLDQPLQQGYSQVLGIAKWAAAFGILGSIASFAIGKIYMAIPLLACSVFAALCLSHLSSIFSAIGLSGIGF